LSAKFPAHLLHQRGQNALICGHKPDIRTSAFISMAPVVVVSFSVHPGLARPIIVTMSPHMQDPGCDFPSISLPRNRVNRAWAELGRY
jgi:hypothetical protein